MKIVLFTVGFGGGGAEQVFVSLANHWSSMGFAVEFWVIKNGGPLRNRLSANITVRTLGVGPRFLQRWVLAKRLKRLVDAHKPDVLFATLNYANCLAGNVAGQCDGKTKFILREANSFENIAKAGRLRYFAMLFWMKKTYLHADAIIVNAESIRKEMLKIASDMDPGKVFNIPNPVRLSERVGLPHDASSGETFKIIACGRLIEQKGFKDLIDAAYKLLNSIEWELTILGDGPMRNELLERCRTYGISDKVSFPGFVEDVREWYLKSHLFVLSSHWEGFPNALVEAMACGLDVLATKCPGACEEILGDRLADRLVPVGSVDSLSKAIARIETEGSKGLIAKQIVEERFRFESIADTYLATVGVKF